MEGRLQPAEILEIRKLAAIAETRQELTPELLQVIYQQQWFKLFIPQKWGGLALGLPDALRLEQSLAAIDGSLGWTVTLCAGANFFAGYIESQLAAQLFTDPTVCWGGSGAATGVATRTKRGYRVTGHWKYATGAPHLSHFTANCQLQENGRLLRDSQGNPLIRSFYFDRRKVQIEKDWKAMGLIATAGHSFSVRDLELDAEQSFLIEPDQARLDDPVYRYPFVALAETTLAVNTLGMTQHFFELAAAVFHASDKPLPAENQLAQARLKTEAVAQPFYELVEASWASVLQGIPVPKMTLRQISGISRRMVRLCRRQVAAIYPFLGVAATAADGELNRIFRDLFTASQHRLLNEPPRSAAS